MGYHEDRPGSYTRPIAVDGTTDFIEVGDLEAAQQAEEIFATQWDYIHGYASEDDLKRLPKRFRGRAVVRSPEELEELGWTGAFDIEELYRYLYGE